MYNKKPTAAGLSMGWRSLVMMSVVALSFGCHKSPGINDKDLRNFDVVNLVANTPEYKPRNHLDPTLINGFGIAWSPTNIAWVNSVLGRVSELYTLEGDVVRPPCVAAIWVWLAAHVLGKVVVERAKDRTIMLRRGNDFQP